MREPPGENTGCDSLRVRPVSARRFPVSTSSSCTALLSPSPVYGPTTLTIANRLPSVDHESGDDGAPGGSVTGSVHAPEVSRLAGALPSDAISHTCAGRGASSSRKWLFW